MDFLSAFQLASFRCSGNSDTRTNTVQSFFKDNLFQPKTFVPCSFTVVAFSLDDLVDHKNDLNANG